jgi:hypothetical protein
VALAPRTQGEAMWRRFKTAQDEIYNRSAAYFAAQNAERSANLVKKQALTERAEALADSSDWVGRPHRFRRCRPTGKRSGRSAAARRRRCGSDSAAPAIASSPSPGGSEEAQGRVVGQPDAEGSALRAGRRPGRLHRLEYGRRGAQETAGGMEDDRARPQGKSEAVWQRFREACDKFFERYKHRDSLELQERRKARTR